MGNSGSTESFQTPSEELTTAGFSQSAHNPGQFQEGEFVNRRGMALRFYEAAPSEQYDGAPKGIVLAHHGIRAHGLFELLNSKPGGPANVYEGSVVELLCQDGFYVYTYDCEGHGKSQSKVPTCRGYFEDVEDLVDDLVMFATLLRKKHPGVPIFGLGTSMGGGVVIGASRQSGVLDGMILIAPMVSVEKIANKAQNKFLLPLIGVLAKWMPKAAICAMESNPDPDLHKTFEEDPLTAHDKFMRVAPSVACLRYCQELAQRLDEVKAPFLTIHAPDDLFTDPVSSDMLMENAQVHDKTFLQPPPGSHHALLTDKASAEWTSNTVKEWLNAHLAN